MDGRRFVGRIHMLGVGLVLALVSVSSVHAAGTPAVHSPAIQAELNGHAISLADVSRFHCHDLVYPLIRCFLTPVERDADEAAVASAGTSPGRSAPFGAAASAISPYVRWYLDANNGGASFDASVAYADLGVIGWNDKISATGSTSGRPATSPPVFLRPFWSSFIDLKDDNVSLSEEHRSHGRGP
ncbi:MAG: hypothetical protein ACOYXS_03495 [Chloroflexota bacterium]